MGAPLQSVAENAVLDVHGADQLLVVTGEPDTVTGLTAVAPAIKRLEQIPCVIKLSSRYSVPTNALITKLERITAVVGAPPLAPEEHRARPTELGTVGLPGLAPKPPRRIIAAVRAPPKTGSTEKKPGRIVSGVADEAAHLIAEPPEQDGPGKVDTATPMTAVRAVCVITLLGLADTSTSALDPNKKGVLIAPTHGRGSSPTPGAKKTRRHHESRRPSVGIERLTVELSPCKPSTRPDLTLRRIGAVQTGDLK